ncbi:AAA family ATPase [Nanoarchaeota archaeon]
MIIGITGPNGSGKGEVANYLKSKGFIYFSLSDVVRQETQKSNLSLTRENLIKTGREIRKERGDGFFAKQIISELKDNSVVDSIRNPSEVEVLKQMGNFVLLGVNAPVGVRFKRSKKRGRVGDGSTVEEFVKLEEEENRGIGQDPIETLKMSNFLIINDKTVDHLHIQIDKILDFIQNEKSTNN